ncbi:response regulator [Pedobacter montanisoli]|uniref:Response regulator n=1 Tax=Pedobacter montanisoli TaxID=2923277 RepID=A0ABS9ZTM7_9SPHI|nr:response regulator [Pedobacter montanisoli]MCJ0741960.1 response regulator [Pedobacter montanisoli]
MIDKLLEPLILIAEDDPDDTLMLMEAFSEINQTSIKFLSNGKLLVEQVMELSQKDFLPKLILIDLNMPVLDGRGVIKALKANPSTENIPVVVLSTTKNKDDIDSVFNLGATDFFTKPSNFSDLVNIAKIVSQKWLPSN